MQWGGSRGGGLLRTEVHARTRIRIQHVLEWQAGSVLPQHAQQVIPIGGGKLCGVLVQPPRRVPHHARVAAQGRLHVVNTLPRIGVAVLRACSNQWCDAHRGDARRQQQSPTHLQRGHLQRVDGHAGATSLHPQRLQTQPQRLRHRQHAWWQIFRHIFARIVVVAIMPLRAFIAAFLPITIADFLDALFTVIIHSHNFIANYGEDGRSRHDELLRKRQSAGVDGRQSGGKLKWLAHCKRESGMPRWQLRAEKKAI